MCISADPRYAREIVPAFNAYFYFRLGFWFARRLSSLFYRVRMGYADDAGLRGIDPKSTPVFIINHRSNMDYVLVAFLAAERTALSYAVGEWARIWPLMSLIKMMGGFFVRRGSGNPLYRKVLERYVKMATEGGVPQAIFPEGGLSRDGRLRPPKLGLMDYMLRGFDIFGPRILPIVNAIRDTMGFIIVMSFVVGGAVHAFYVLLAHLLPEFSGRL